MPSVLVSSRAEQAVLDVLGIARDTRRRCSAADRTSEGSVNSDLRREYLFKGLQERVLTLQQSQRQNPLSIEILVNSTKRFLTKPEYRFQLDELVTEETDRLIVQLDIGEFATPGQWDPM